MTKNEVMLELERLGDPAVKQIMKRHGAREPFFGVRVQDLKHLQKKIKKDHQLALELYKTGNTDAMYLAGLIAEPSNFSKEELTEWVNNAYWYMLSEYTVAWMAAENKNGLQLALEWIDSPFENIASSGWATISGIIAITNDLEINMDMIRSLLIRCDNEILTSPNRVKYTMNNFIISVGTYVKPLVNDALEAAGKIGKVIVDMGETSCKVPDAVEYINKVKFMGRIGKKRQELVY